MQANNETDIILWRAVTRDLRGFELADAAVSARLSK